MAQRTLQSRTFRPGIGLPALAVLAAMVFTLPTQANGQHPKRKDQYKHQVEQLEQAWRTAELSGDVDAMSKLLSDDFVGINMTGQVVTKMQMLDRMRRRSLVLTKYELNDVKVKLIGMTAVVTSLANVEGSNEGTPMHGTFRYTRVYSRLATGTWQITNFEATRVGPPPPPPPGGRPPRTEAPKPE